jgi:hypothetical protein
MHFNRSKDSRRPNHFRLAYLLAPAFLIGALAIGGPAQAAGHSPARGGIAAARAATAAQVPSSHATTRSPQVRPDAGCDFTNGTTSNLRLSAKGPAPTEGTVFTMPSGTTCYDLNLSYVSATDGYEGWLQDSHTGVWFHCSRGFVRITAGHHSVTNPPYLCTDVLPGTKMAVVQESSTRRSITVED